MPYLPLFCFNIKYGSNIPFDYLTIYYLTIAKHKLVFACCNGSLISNLRSLQLCLMEPMKKCYHHPAVFIETLSRH